MTWQACPNTRPRFLWLAALSAIGLFACASGGNNSDTGGSNGSRTGGTSGGSTGGSSGSRTGGSTGTSSGGSSATGGTSVGSTGGTTGGGTGGSTTGGGTGGSTTGGGTGGRTGGTSGGSTGGTAGGAGGSIAGCTNTSTGVINLDASGYVCNNTWGIKGAWYCYSDGSDTTNSCKGSDGKGAGAIPWNASSAGMCLSGTMGTGSGKYAGIGFKVNSGPPGTTPFSTFDASSIVGFAITLAPGASGKGSGGMVLNLEYPTTTNLTVGTLDAPGVTLPGVATAPVTYNVLFSDGLHANEIMNHTTVDPTKLTDVKLAFFPDSVSHSYDFCIKSVVPLMSAPRPVVATGAYGPPWNNNAAQAVNGINGYAVQSAPFPMVVGNPMTMQVNATAGGVGFSYTAGAGFQAPNNGPGSFPAVISGWGPGVAGAQFYGPYKGGKTIATLASVKSNWTFTQGSSGDSVYDVWFGNSAQPPAAGIELMIWMGNKDKMPIGSVAGPAVTGSDGVARTPYMGTNGTQQRVVSYWIPQGATGNATNFDLLPYFKDAASHAYAGLSNGSFLLGVQTGFEVYSGTWVTTDYSITIQ